MCILKLRVTAEAQKPTPSQINKQSWKRANLFRTSARFRINVTKTEVFEKIGATSSRVPALVALPFTAPN